MDSDVTAAAGARADERLAVLATERIDDRHRDLDTVPTVDALRAMNDAEAEVPRAVRAVLPQVADLVDAVADRLRRGGRLFYVGAGTSGRLGVLDAAECPPTFHVDPERVQAVIAGGPSAVFAAVEGAEDSDTLGAAELVRLEVGAADVVVGIAASGRTPFVLGALRAARDASALTAGISCNIGSPLGLCVDHPLEVEVGPEVLAGSTRLKAGSATKQLLNMISTGAMVRIGKTYGNLMVDLAITNSKLRDRGERLVMRISHADRPTAARALTDSGLRVPVASVMLVLGVDRVEAEHRLAAADGRLAAVLGERAPHSS
jgi:N-acetylmuramic acid 6-phosphate etherase